MPTLDVYSQVLDGFASKNFHAVCVGFDGLGPPFWFGSTIHRKANKALLTRQGLLVEALAKQEVYLPLVPPTHQESVANQIMNIALEKSSVDKTADWWIAARQSCVKLFQLMTVRGDSSRMPWKLVGTLTPNKNTNFKTARAAVVTCISVWPERPPTLTVQKLTSRLEFSKIKESLEINPLLFGPVYGHCAETYPFIFLLNRQVFVLFFTSSSIPLGHEHVIEPRLHCEFRIRKPVTNTYEGMSRSPDLLPKCKPFYVGNDGGSVACMGVRSGCSERGECYMKCREPNLCNTKCQKKGRCKVVCKQDCNTPCNVCKQTCVGTKECEGACKNGKDCETRCVNNDKCGVKNDVLVQCRRRRNRCAACQIGGGLCTGEEDGKLAPCWRRICEQCMNSGPCCEICRLTTICPTCNSARCLPDCRHRCYECNVPMKPPCLNCASIITEMKWTKYSSTVEQRGTDCSHSFTFT